MNSHAQDFSQTHPGEPPCLRSAVQAAVLIDSDVLYISFSFIVLAFVPRRCSKLANVWTTASCRISSAGDAADWRVNSLTADTVVLSKKLVHELDWFSAGFRDEEPDEEESDEGAKAEKQEGVVLHGCEHVRGGAGNHKSPEPVAKG